MAEKMLQLQMQMRQNHREVGDFLNDLESWTSDIKKQDENLKRMKPKENANTSHPPVRSAAVLQKVKKKKEEENKYKKPERIKSADYRKWEKLDVDAMLQQVDDEEREMEEEVQVEVDKLDEERRAKVAIEMKEKGNEHFKNSGYQAAIECYTTGMQADPSNAVFPANRAMAYLKLKRYAETEADCTLALSLDPTYTKAYLRRGTARVAVGKLSGAKKDFTDALRIEPCNKQAKLEIQKLNKMGKQGKITAKKITKSTGSSKKSSKYVQPIFKPPLLRSRKPLMRVQVQEIGYNNGDEEKSEKVNRDHAPLTEIIQDSAQLKEKPGTNMISVVSKSVGSEPVKHNIDASKKEEDKKGETMAESTNTSLGGKDSEILKNVSKAPANAAEHKTLGNTKPCNGLVLEVPSHPATSFQFQADVKRLQHSPGKLYLYLRQITPSHLPSLLKQQLETETLMPILHCLHKSSNGEEIVFDYLQQLAKVRRFEMTILFMSDDEKKDVVSLLRHMGDLFPTRTDDIRVLTKKYGL